eukprot:comp20770_c0_seq1/m.42784 comp20770_c0_seq1/g.42784  ORF comp20770_c0_seq1/g.42784 comp20770_c0_seq1/m.42784 type:complete len:360 (-) comp20770_c0_seq1:55-1134(-)
MEDPNVGRYQLQRLALRSAPMQLPAASDTSIWDVWMSQHQLPVINAAIYLELFAKIDAAGPHGVSMSELATQAVSSERAIQAILDVLTSLSFTRRSNGRYTLTPSAKIFLLPGPNNWAPMLAGDAMSAASQRIIDAATEDKAFGAVEEWEAGGLSEERAEILTKRFHAHSLSAAIGCAKLVPFTQLGITKLLDVGGGSGCFAIALVREHPDMVATVVDLDVVCRIVTRYAEEAHVSDRVLTLPLDFFRDTWPSPEEGFNGIFMSNILHDWSQAQCMDLLTRSFNTLAHDGKIVLHEMLINDNRDGPLTTALFSIHMVVYTRGNQFTFAELASMLTRVGFKEPTVYPSFGYYSCVVATKP